MPRGAPYLGGGRGCGGRGPPRGGAAFRAGPSAARGRWSCSLVLVRAITHPVGTAAPVRSRLGRGIARAMRGGGGQSARAHVVDGRGFPARGARPGAGQLFHGAMARCFRFLCNLHVNTMPRDAMRSLVDAAPARDRLGNAAHELVSMRWSSVMPQTSKTIAKSIQPRAINTARDERIRPPGFGKRHFQHRWCRPRASARPRDRCRRTITGLASMMAWGRLSAHELHAEPMTANVPVLDKAAAWHQDSAS